MLSRVFSKNFQDFCRVIFWGFSVSWPGPSFAGDIADGFKNFWRI
jgi:hypothetical protein